MKWIKQIKPVSGKDPVPLFTVVFSDKNECESCCQFIKRKNDSGDTQLFTVIPEQIQGCNQKNAHIRIIKSSRRGRHTSRQGRCRYHETSDQRRMFPCFCLLKRVKKQDSGKEGKENILLLQIQPAKKVRSKGISEIRAKKPMRIKYFLRSPVWQKPSISRKQMSGNAIRPISRHVTASMWKPVI